MNYSLRQILLLIFLAVIVLVSFLFNRQQSVKTEPVSAPPLLVINNSETYRYNAQGVTDMHLQSQKTIYYNDDRGTHFQAPVLTQINPPIKQILQANTAVQNHAKTEIFMQGNVIGQRNNTQNTQQTLTFKTPALTYRVSENTAETNTHVTILTPNSTTYATGALWHLKQNLFILKKNVRSTYAPAY
ncbi:LPS export ABC transporter periplasmic protein LptC [Suttonella ornithocola]|uniref:Lipopolysaccharide exporter periplasmic protein n=1 Tax=Suttonella ornithocola TaxID=279832 RepID=A0A380MSU8_9GAMM|nr:LPS export ABC transporter periplasmic protein LptC [Suttonella ornithocola]SUO95368.1 lipopolysaccharide exporter periplasmic protein [Suttonella ornithocola]